jgi:hypothetical protein
MPSGENRLYSDCTRRQKNMELMDDLDSIFERIGQFEAYGGPRMTFESWWVHEKSLNRDWIQAFPLVGSIRSVVIDRSVVKS